MVDVALFCLLPSTIFAANLQDLVSASNDFEIEMIKHEHVLEQNPSSTELAVSTLRKSVPTLIDMATGRAAKTREFDQREIFSGYRGRHGFDAETT